MRRLIVSLAATLAILSSNLIASEASKAASKEAVDIAKSRAIEKKDEIKIVKEAVDAVALTNEALNDLEKNRKDKAVKKLNIALNKLEKIVNLPNTPALIPIDSSIEVVEFPGSLKDIEIALITVKALLNANKIQEARRALNLLRSEIDIKTVNLPLATYPSTLKLAIKFLKEDRVDEAKSLLNEAISTFVIVDIITPLPIIKAQHLIELAKELSKKDRKKALEYLNEAKISLKKAQALGYTSRSDITYKNLKESIENIEKEIKEKNEAEKLFEELIQKLKDFKEKAINKISK